MRPHGTIGRPFALSSGLQASTSVDFGSFNCLSFLLLTYLKCTIPQSNYCEYAAVSVLLGHMNNNHERNRETERDPRYMP